MPWNKISASIRLIMAMFRLYAGMEASWGRVVKDILRKQYPDAKAEIDSGMSDQALGQKMLAIAMKQTQYDETKAQDAVQNALAYFSTGTTRYESAEEQEERYQERLEEYKQKPTDSKGKKKAPPEPPKTPQPFDFTKGSPTWEDALRNIYSNIRTKAMSGSMGYTKKEKRERSIDQAYGQRGEEGGAKEGGEGRMPTPDAPGGVSGLSNIGQALDDKAGVKQFIDLIDENLPDLKDFLNSRSPDQLKLFSLVFDDDVGSFGSDVKENMSQATALKEKYPELYEKNQKRWSGFVGDLRKKVLAGIWDFVEKHLTPSEYETLYDTFFSDTTPTAVDKAEKEKSGGKLEYQQGIDERKLAKWKWMEQEGKLSDKEKASYDALKKKLQDTVDIDAVPATEAPQAKGWTLHSKRAAFSLEAVSSRVMARFSRVGT
jgi:hypothetical protein